MPVPPRTALHQLFSVPPTGRCLGGGSSDSDIIEEERVSYKTIFGNYKSSSFFWFPFGAHR